MTALNFSQAISRANVILRTNVSETSSVAIIRDDIEPLERILW
jgi:hypothetical protein